MAYQNTYVDNGDGTITVYTYDENGNCTEKTMDKSSKEAQDIMKSEDYIEQIITIGKYTIPYKTTNGGKIRFPDVSGEIPVMGLPPMGYGVEGDLNLGDSLLVSAVGSGTASLVSGTSVNLGSFARGFVTNTVLGLESYKQALQSFPLLYIEPLDVIYSSKETDKGDNGTSKSVSTNVAPVKYVFAVDPQNLTISYNHTNNFQESSIEGKMKSLMHGSTMNELRQFSATSGGMFGSGGTDLTNILNKMAGGVENELRGNFDSGIEGMKKDEEMMKKWGNQVDLLYSMGNTLIDTLINGGRIDFPNIWTDSQTTNSQTFTINLRTISSDPTNKHYWREIILPLYCLLTLALPPGGMSAAYTNPPYIKCSLDNGFYETKLGGISSFNIEFPASEFNFLKVPRHVAVSLTITDMYNIMSQDVINPEDKKVATNTNLNFTTKDKLMERFAKATEGKSVYNAAVMSTEYDWSGLGALVNTVGEAVNVVSTVVTGISNTGSTGTAKVATTSTGTSSGSSSSSTSSGTTSPSSIRPLDDNPNPPLTSPISDYITLHFEGNSASAGVLVMEAAGITIGTLKRVKNVVPTSSESALAVKNFVLCKEDLELNKGFKITIKVNGETPEISPSFITKVSTKVYSQLLSLIKN